jgi:5-methylcytosine-specific restriction protein B
MDNRKSWYFSFAKDRKKDDIPVLWDMAGAIVNQMPQDIDPDLFKKCLAVKQVGLAKLTIAMFWLRPEDYLALDSVNERFFKHNGYSIQVDDYGSYLDLLKRIRKDFAESFSDLSHQAYQFAEGKWVKKGGHNSRNETDLSVNDLNLILYGPPGTGKTYRSVRMAVQICDGAVPDDPQKVNERFRQLQSEGRIAFVTFHQSYGYEEFVEGIRPVIFMVDDEDDTVSQSIRYEIRDGIFKSICTAAKSTPTESHQVYSLDDKNATVWKMSLGNTLNPEQTHIFDDCISGNYIRLGYGKGLDFSGCDDRQSTRKWTGMIITSRPWIYLKTE